MALSKIQQSQLNSARIVGGTPSVYVTNGELAFLLCLVCHDLKLALPDTLSCEGCVPVELDFYSIPVHEVYCPDFDVETVSNQIIDNSLSQIIATHQDIFTYFWALISLHAQRKKYQAILQNQPIPDLETIIPRSLLELGSMPDDALAAWLVWRKFIYDLDNRAAQTTGYMFEPILTASIGGATYSASKSPVRRSGTGSGRQVDCLINQNAYEFKMRVTIAASGQGRFAEELSFAEDCYRSGYRPILLVLDPTPSAKLDELARSYRKFNGEAYIGDDAWSHLEAQAGEIMGRFLDHYIRKPLARIAQNQLTDLPGILLEHDTATDQIHIVIDSRRYPLR